MMTRLYELIHVNDNYPVYLEVNCCEYCDHDQFTAKGRHLVCNYCGFVKVFR